MTDSYNDALRQQSRQNIWTRLREEAVNMSGLERANVAADIAGIFDPSPASDTVGAILSVARGDFWGAGASVLGYIPYVGDLAKIPKIARIAPRTARALETMIRHGSDLANAGEAFLRNNFTLRQIAAARAQAAARVQRALMAARRGTPNCRDCARLPGGGRGRLQMPATGGRWNPPNATQTGSGTFTFDNPVTLPNGRVVRSVEYRNGFPNFDNYVVSGKHNLWEVSGDASVDAARLRRQIGESNPSWRPPDRNQYVLHHFENGQVGYVPRAVHDRALGGVAHSGGNTIVNNRLF